jgi:adenine deaminase
MSSNYQIAGNIIDPVSRRIYKGVLYIENGRIVKIDEKDDVEGHFILPGFVDSHVHIESSMLSPVKFAEAAVKHGTVAVVADPHEVANVAGVDGVEFMINSSKDAKMKIYFGAPSCVPASPIDECFQKFSSKEISFLLDLPQVKCLAEMMNFPGVINKDKHVLSILNEAKKRNLPIDGHAPGLSGDDLQKYVAEGISTDHECFTLQEALAKIELGMKVLIREGSAAKNFDSLHSLISLHPEMVMFCTDDCHPDELQVAHINKHVKKALRLGYDLFDVLQVASINPVKHYNLEVGLLQVGDPADFIIIDNLNDFKIVSTYINGENVTSICNSSESIKIPEYEFINSFAKEKIRVNFSVNKTVKVIEVIEGELITNKLLHKANGNVYDTENDILKIVVQSRYNSNNLGVGFIKGFGVKDGAIAASIAHDSHHVVSVGANDESIRKAVEYVVGNRGGLCYYDGANVYGMPLPFYGLMTVYDVETAARLYSEINERLKKDGCVLHAPFMTMAFMSLSVIPHLKLTPQGLFDVDNFSLTDLVDL